MNMWAFLALVVIVPVIVEYFKTKEKYKQQLSSTGDELEQVQKQLESMEKRLENLEAIAATEPDNFESSGRRYREETMESENSGGYGITNDLDERDKNRKKVSEMAGRKQKQ